MSTTCRQDLLNRLSNLDLAIMQAMVRCERNQAHRLNGERAWVRRCLERNELLPLSA